LQTQTDTQPTSGGPREYLRRLAEFSHNARMVLAYSAFTGLAFGVFRLLFNFYVLSLGGYTELFQGNLTSAQSVASLLMALPAAYIAQRFSQKRIMVISGWASVLNYLGMVTLPGRWSLIGFSLSEGLATSVRQVAAAPFLMNNTGDSERQYVFSFNFGLMTLAQFVGNQVGGYLPLWFGNALDVAPTSNLAYRLALSCMVVVSLIAILPLMGIRPAARPPVEAAGDTTFRAFLGDVWAHGGDLLKFVIPQVIIGLGAGLMMPFMNLYFRNVLGQTDAAIGTLFGLSAFGMAIAQFIAPPLAGRFGKINTVILTQALSIPFLMSLGLVAYVVTARAGSLNLAL
jgi:Na+/melibiose symporter-like transporter